MVQNNTIPKDSKRRDTQNFAKLRDLGMQYIEKFCKNVWTDYNVHDPGITQLEILGYAITDLSLRTSLPVEDLIARMNSDKTKDFFSAREILPCNPVTVEDLRKKFIDVDGVDNAWVTPYDDEECAPVLHPAFSVHCNKNPLTIDLNPIGGEPRTIKGLYEFKLLLEEDPVLGDLNIMSVDWEKKNASQVREALIRFTFPLTVKKVYPLNLTPASDDLTLIDKLVSDTISDFSIPVFDANANTFDLILSFSSGATLTIHNVAYHILPYDSLTPQGQIETSLQNFLTSGNPTEHKEIMAMILFVFQEKVKAVNQIVDAVYCAYQPIRNLCEDVYSIGVVDSQEIAVCADVETDTDADLEQILGTIYYEIDNFFSPLLRFYSLKDLLDGGLTSDEIFEGPLLRHGFIQDDELRQTSLFDTVHISDLYGIIMSIPGVKRVTYLQITNYLNGLPKKMTDSSNWKIDLNGSFHLNLDRLRSKILFYKRNLPILADKQVANRFYEDLKAAIAKPRTMLSLQELNDLVPPPGTWFDLDEFYSVQNDFPFVYGVGPDGLPSGINVDHKSRIKQLKGYLLFFDQLLANYLSQLSELKNLYAVGNQDPRTYFFQPVYDEAELSGSETLNFYGTAPLLSDFTPPVTADVDDVSTFLPEWTTFVQPASPAVNNYKNELGNIVEPSDNKLDRRNRFLDHLLARFAENFSDYAIMMYDFSNSQLRSTDRKTAQQIVHDKYSFLSDYHVLSYNRGKGQFYKCCSVSGCNPGTPVDGLADDELQVDIHSTPKPSNSTGLQSRVTRMLGFAINDNSRIALGRFSVNSSHVFSIAYGSQALVPPSGTTFADDKAACDAMELIIELLAKESDNPDIWKYFSVKPFGMGYKLSVSEDALSVTAPVLAESSLIYGDVATAKEGFEELKKAVFSDCEGMHVFDHILLRPLPIQRLGIAMPTNPSNSDFGFFPLCPMPADSCDCPVTDPYSFRISVVLPYWTERFRNMAFRSFAQDTIHRETPAHILPKFCWIGLYDMIRLENAYEDWFTLNSLCTPDLAALEPKLETLIRTLNTLTNVYPEGRLHDCANPSTDNPVILNKTMLGTF